MNDRQKHIIGQMNSLGAQGQSFAFLIDFDFEKPRIFDFEDTSQLIWQTPEMSNFSSEAVQSKPVEWTVHPVAYSQYEQAFREVQRHIHAGDTYLLNLTMPSKVDTNLSLKEIFYRSEAPFKIWFRDEFVCFSPEIFVRINDGVISSYPMKGTIDAGIENAGQLLLNDEKEVAEHHTIVDLIRNDLSIVASDVQVDRLMYLDRLRTNRGDLLQMSSRISGKLPADYQKSIGTILVKMLPAGSICGAPKPKTVELIRKAENYERGYYTGIFGVFDGKNLDSCVLIRYLEQNGDKLVFKSGGGITFMSDCQTEYNELIRKVYVPIT
jgi:para-aminobenzoate synthetase component 1